MARRHGHKKKGTMSAHEPRRLAQLRERLREEVRGSTGGVVNVDDDDEVDEQPPTGEAVEGLPALHLLDDEKSSRGRGYSDEDLQALSRLLELKLKDYGIEAEVSSVFPGPVITRFEIQPAAGVKVSRITSLAKDLAR